MRKTYTILGVIAVIVLVVYSLIPDSFFVESVYPLEEGMFVTNYDDRADGGFSNASLKMGDSSMKFECTLGTDTTVAAWCGMLWNFDPDTLESYRNWIFVDSLIFDVETSGTDEILVKLWAYDPDVTDVKKPKTFRLLMKEVKVSGGRERIVVPMEQFYTPDFWYEDAHVDKELNKRHQESMARVEIAPGWNQPRGKTFSIVFHGVSAKGLSNFWFGAVLFAFLGITIVAVGFRHHKKNEDKED
jgi:hypothetical protein